jgi:hypothetical protein
MVKADFITGIVLILISVYVIIESWRMPRLEHLQVHPLSVPGLVPAFLAVVIILFAIQLVIRSVHRGGHRLGITREAFLRTLREPGNQRLLVTAVLTIVYAGFFIGRLPYWLATGLFVFAFVVVFEKKKEMTRAQWTRCTVVAALLATITAAAVSLAFERLFLVTLP